MSATPLPPFEYERRRKAAEELARLEERYRPEDIRFFFLMMFVSLACIAVVVPYRSIHLPQLLLAGVGIAGILFLLPVALERADLMALLLLTYLPFNKVLPGTFGGFASAFNATNIMLGLTLLSWVLAKMRQRRAYYRPERLDLLLGLFVFIAMFSLVRGFLIVEHRNPIDVLFALKRFVTPMLVYYIVVNNLETLRENRLAMISIILSTTLIALLTMKKYYMDMGGGGSMAESRAVATSGANHLGFLLCTYPFLLLAFWYAYRNRNRWVWSLWIPFLICVQGVRTTFSRGAQVGFAAGLWCFLFLTNRILALVYTCILVFFALHPQQIPQRIGGRLSHTVRPGPGDVTDRLDKSASSRLVIWGVASEIIREYPLLGVGYHNFPRVFQRHRPGMGRKDAHNTYIIIATEMGLPALGVFLLFLLGAAWVGLYVWWNAGDDPILRAGGMGYLCVWTASTVGNLFGTRFDSNEVTIQFFALTAVVCTLAHIIDLRKEVEHTPPPPTRESEEAAASRHTPGQSLGHRSDAGS